MRCGVWWKNKIIFKVFKAYQQHRHAISLNACITNQTILVRKYVCCLHRLQLQPADPQGPKLPPHIGLFVVELCAVSFRHTCPLAWHGRKAKPNYSLEPRARRCGANCSTLAWNHTAKPSSAVHSTSHAMPCTGRKVGFRAAWLTGHACIE
jgi:hypothetical protein